MEFTVTNDNTGKYITLKGQFTFADNQHFKQIVTLAKEEAVQAITLDFSDVSFIDSAGLGMLLLLRDECQKKNVQVSISAPRGQVERIFMISKFDQLFSIHSGKA